MREREEHPPDDEPLDPSGEPDADAETGAPEESPATDRLPALPADDDSPLGDTDQHSDA
ncbi:MAG TPA: hypothetical protein VG365_11700 [Solirubrobacteraceae bacterium]|nr:hypothetical protein [Solirubrobacteraceae bacterium]